MRLRSTSCKESRDAAAVGAKDALAARRSELHRASCADCAAYQARLAQARRAIVDAAEPGLDDVQRARIGARVAAAVDDLRDRRARRRRLAYPSTLTAAFALGLAAGLLLFLRSRLVPPPVAPPPPAGPALALIRPYVIAGAAARDAAAELALARPVDRLDVPAGGLVRATLGVGARVTLVGPATLLVQEVARDAIELRLGAGVLVGEYDHERGGTLRISSPGALTTVVGTVFAIDAASGDSSRVSVSRGQVEVRAGETAVRVDAGWSYRVGAAGREALPSATAALLAEQAAAFPPPRAWSAALTVRGTPEHAEIELAGAPLGPTPLVTALPPGAIRLSVRAERHDPLALPATIPEKGSLELSYVLPPSGDAHARRTVEPAKPRPATEAVSADRRGSASEPPANEAARKPAPAAAAVPSPTVETADDVYARAEAAMRAGDRATARARLTEVVRRFPAHPLADAALYELARLAAADAPARAREYLEELLGRGIDPTLREPARFLRCRLDFDARREPAAAACLDAFHRDFPTSSHDAEALALLIGLAQARYDCRTARSYIDEYLRRYPAGPFAREAAERRTRCAR